MPPHPDADAPPSILSREESQALFQRISGLTTGGGDLVVLVRSSWAGRFRWARNRPLMTTTTTTKRVMIRRLFGDVIGDAVTDVLDDASLTRAVREAESHAQVIVKEQNERKIKPGEPVLSPPQQYANPPLWDKATFNMSARDRAEAAYAAVTPVLKAKLVTAGYLETSAETWGIFNTKGLAAYAAATGVKYTETVRNPTAKGSGWAGLSHTSWAKLDVKQISARALERCQASANPVRVEPGRWTAILEPEATAHFLLVAVDRLRDRPSAARSAGVGEENPVHPYGKKEGGKSKLGERVFDERITLRSDPMDPDIPFIPFDADGYPHRPITWVENGVLKELSYDTDYARKAFHTEVPLPIPYACRMSGSDTSHEEMIATTERGLLVTRFGHASEGNQVEGDARLLIHTVTMDGVWLIEKGKIKGPAVNLRVDESPLYVFNNVLQLGRPERVLGYGWTNHNDLDLDWVPTRSVGELFPMVAPPIKVRDFNFTALTDAI